MSKTSSLQLERSDLRRLIDLAKAESKREINCHAVGTIIAFDPTTATANITLNYKKILKQRNAINLREYSDVVVEYPVLVRCPIVIMNGGGAYTTYPIAAGDSCLVLFCDRDIDVWFEFGSTQSPPNSERMHDLSDAVAIVGINPLNKVISNYSTTSVKTWFGRVLMEFTNLVASIKDKHGERLVPVGTGPVPTLLSAAPNGWLFMYGQTMGKPGSGAVESSNDYDDLFNILRTVSPNSGGDFSNGDLVIIPDMRGKVAITVDNLGGSQAEVLTALITPNRNAIGGQTGQETVNIRHNHLGATEGVTFGSGPTGIPGEVTAGALDTTHYHVIENDLSATQTIVQPGILVNAMIKY